jgi:hypothetical protein
MYKIKLFFFCAQRHWNKNFHLQSKKSEFCSFYSLSNFSSEKLDIIVLSDNNNFGQKGDLVESPHLSLKAPLTLKTWSI